MQLKNKIVYFGMIIQIACEIIVVFNGSFFDDSINKKRALDKAIDSIREKYGNEAIIRSTFINSNVKPLCGGVGESDYPMMGSVL